MYTQSPRPGVSQTILPSRARGVMTSSQGRAAQSAKALTLSDLHALVVKLEARLVVQEEKITVLQRENSELWQEVHRLKGPRFPVEIFLFIVDSARDDKEALKTFSLVCKSWMPITRNILFARISLSAMFWYVKIKPGQILNSPHCTVFPHVRTINIDGSMDDGSDHHASRENNWMDDVLVHMAKFTALTSLELYTLGSWDLDAIDRAISRSRKRGIRRLDLYHPVYLTMSQIAVFISKFTDLTTLECGEIDRSWEEDALTDFLGTNELLVAPPSSITKLIILLDWFTDLHLGGFINRFGGSLSHIKLSISGHDADTVQFLESKYLATLSQLKSIVLTFSESAYDCLPQTFVQLPPSIEEITLFLINIRDPDQLSRRERAATWSQLDRTLVETKFSSLRSLSIVCGHMFAENEKHMRRILPKLLPHFAKKQILTIKFE
ncbi:hypothetical protein B0H14DRAFT_2857132 [Mycena olivaceomarginata]|nr:hypothetical protein B0H14DRAFT_2857132 [Mycena olivaceomarginata]